MRILGDLCDERTMKVDLTEEVRDKIVADYLAGRKTWVIETRYKVAAGTLYLILHARNVKLRRRVPDASPAATATPVAPLFPPTGSKLKDFGYTTKSGKQFCRKPGRPRTGEVRRCLDCGIEVYLRRFMIKRGWQRCKECARKVALPPLKVRQGVYIKRDAPSDPKWRSGVTVLRSTPPEPPPLS